MGSGCQKLEGRRPVLERGPTGSGDPGRRTGALPRPASGAPASAPLFPPELEAPSPERHRQSGAGRGGSCGRQDRAEPGGGGPEPGTRTPARPHEPRRTLQRAEPQRRVR